MTEQEEDRKLALDSRRWKNRRKMAWLSLIAAVIQTAFLMIMLAVLPIPHLEALSGYGVLFIAIYGFYAGIIMSYVGTAAYSDVKLWG